MPPIRLLDEGTISRIAAGEVIERPASVVKELVENALDAGAEHIEVEITTKGGAVRSIRVTDDGTGMEEPDAALVFTRHATSKIRTLDDLDHCGSLGFRGEALASIAAVSRVTLTTRARGEALSGTCLVNEGGTFLLHEECGSPAGTTVLVEELFYNTPARRKFQRSVHAEMAYITGVMERIALSRPDVSFRALHNRRELLATPGGGLHDAVLHLFGPDLARELLPVEFQGSTVLVRGEVSRPALSRQNPYQVFLSVNGRLVQSRALALAAREGYGTLLPSDRFPVAFLDLSIEPALVDVNVHPAKREVRLSREHEVREELAAAVREALARENLIPGATVAGMAGTQATLLPGRNDISSTSPATLTRAVREPQAGYAADTDRRLRQTELGTPTPPGELSQVPELEVLGQLDATYILASTQGGEDLILIDQHAAHERILYEQTVDATLRERASQELLAPVVLHLSPREAALLPELIPVLEEEGFSVEEFGSGSYAVRSVPVVLGRNAGPGGVREITSSLLAGAAEGGKDREAVRRMVACRGAIKAGTPISPEQCRRLVQQLRRTRNPYTCPHGRPTMVTIPRRQLDVLFLRA